MPVAEGENMLQLHGAAYRKEVVSPGDLARQQNLLSSSYDWHCKTRLSCVSLLYSLSFDFLRECGRNLSARKDRRTRMWHYAEGEKTQLPDPALP